MEPNRENTATSRGDRKFLLAAQSLGKRGNTGIQRTGGADDLECAADNECEEDHITHLGERGENRLKKLEQANGVLLNIVERGRIDHCTVKRFVKITSIFTRRDNVSQYCENSSEKKEENVCVWQAKLFLFHFFILRFLYRFL